MSGSIGFDPASLEAAAKWCVENDTNYNEGLNWIDAAVNPQLGGRTTFNALSTKAALLQKTGSEKEAADMMNAALEKASAQELHGYGRQLISENKLTEALDVFQKNYTKNKGAWPTNAGMMRIYSAMGNYKKALEHARAALPQAPDEPTKKFLQAAINNLESGKPI